MIRMCLIGQPILAYTQETLQLEASLPELKMALVMFRRHPQVMAVGMMGSFFDGDRLDFSKKRGQV